MTSTTLSSPACRAYWWARSIGAHRRRNPEAFIRGRLVAKDWPAEAAASVAEVVRWWALNGQFFHRLGDEPAPCELDAALLAEHVRSRA